jgi:hypothetical protein
VTDRPRPAALSLWLYGAAFAFMLVAAGFIAAAGLGELQETRLLWISTWLSAGAIVLALLGLLLPRRAAR